MGRYTETAGQNRHILVLPVDFDIDGGATNRDILLAKPPTALTLETVRVIYSEATAASGITATVQIGTTAGGSDIVAAATLSTSQAVGDHEDLTIADTSIPANTALYIRHVGQATSPAVAGRYFVQVSATET